MIIFSDETFPLIVEGKIDAFALKIDEKLKLKRSLRHGGHVWERPKHRLSAIAREVGPRKHELLRRSRSGRWTELSVCALIKATFTWSDTGNREGVSVSASEWLICLYCVKSVSDPAEGSIGGPLWSLSSDLKSRTGSALEPDCCCTCLKHGPTHELQASSSRVLLFYSFYLRL